MVAINAWNYSGDAVTTKLGTAKVGDDAPDFELAAVTGTQRHTLKLSSFRGKKNVVLAFYALDWSPT